MLAGVIRTMGRTRGESPANGRTFRGLALAVLALAPCTRAPFPWDGEEPARDPLARVAVLGASVSAGFNLVTEFDAAIDLGDVLACVLPEGTPPVVTAASTGLFLDPLGRGSALVEELVQADPSLVVAVDFPFWFGYGHLPGGDAARLERLEAGLDLLGRLRCPLVVGDFPDVSRALEGQGPFGPMIHASQVPDEATRAALNQRLTAWAEERGDVVVLPLGEGLDAFAEGHTIEVRGNRFGAPPLSRWLQPDLLHPTVEGTIAVAVQALDRFVAGRPDLAQRAWSWGAEEVRSRLERATAPEREERQARRRRREERRRGRGVDQGGEERSGEGAQSPPGGFVLPAGAAPPREEPRHEEPGLHGVRPRGREEVATTQEPEDPRPRRRAVEVP